MVSRRCTSPACTAILSWQDCCSRQEQTLKQRQRMATWLFILLHSMAISLLLICCLNTELLQTPLPMWVNLRLTFRFSTLSRVATVLVEATFKMELRSLSSDDGNGNENVARKCSFISFVLLRDHFNSFNFYRNGELPRNQIGRSGVQVEKENENSPSCVHILTKPWIWSFDFVVLQRTAKKFNKI